MLYVTLLYNGYVILNKTIRLIYTKMRWYSVKWVLSMFPSAITL